MVVTALVVVRVVGQTAVVVTVTALVVVRVGVGASSCGRCGDGWLLLHHAFGICFWHGYQV